MSYTNEYKYVLNVAFYVRYLLMRTYNHVSVSVYVFAYICLSASFNILM